LEVDAEGITPPPRTVSLQLDVYRCLVSLARHSYAFMQVKGHLP
jgi:hypothetical protein